jgi:tight adherence protein B
VRRAAAIAVVGLLCLATGGTARAATDGRIDEITQQGDGLAILFSATTLTPGTTIDPGSVAVTIGGVPVPASAKGFGDSGDTSSRTAVLALDVSGSMKGEPIRDAQAAAKEFLTTVPSDVSVGLVTFSDRAAVTVRPTTDRGTVAAAADHLEAGGRTALYDGVLAATDATGTQGSRSVVLLGDGANDTGSTTLKQAAAAVAESGVGLDAVAFGDGASGATAALSALAAAGSGQVFGARQASDISAAFAASAASLDSQLQIQARIPEGTKNTASVAVTASAGGVTVSDSAVTLLKAPGVAPPSTQTSGPTVVETSGIEALAQPWVMLMALGLLFLGLVGVVLIAISGSDTREGRVSRRLSAYDMGTGKTSKTAGDRTSDVAKTAVELAGRVTAKRDMDQVLGLKLEAAGLPLKPAEWLLIHVGFTFAGLFVLGLLTGFRLVPMLVGAAIGFAGPYIYLGVRSSRRRAQFDDAVPDTLQLVAGSLSAGHSILQAFDTVVRESGGVMREELGRAIVEARLGVPIEDALEAVAERMGSEDFGWVVMAIRVQRQIGGDLAEVLRNVAGMLRERERVRRQVSVLSAEGRLSAYVLIGLPLAFATYMILVRPE